MLLENPSPYRNRGPYTAIVTEQYKYVRKSGRDKLFDLTNDPGEQTNLIDEVTTLDLGAKLDALEVCSGETCRAAEDS